MAEPKIHQSTMNLITISCMGTNCFFSKAIPRIGIAGSVLSSHFSWLPAGLWIRPALWRLEIWPCSAGRPRRIESIPDAARRPRLRPAHGFGYAQTNQAWRPALEGLEPGHNMSAVGYTLSGPTAGFVGDTYTYTVTPAASVADTVTLSDSSGGGQFSPTSLTFSGSSTARRSPIRQVRRARRVSLGHKCHGRGRRRVRRSVCRTSHRIYRRRAHIRLQKQPDYLYGDPGRHDDRHDHFSGFIGRRNLCRRHRSRSPARARRKHYVRARLDRHEDADADSTSGGTIAGSPIALSVSR